MCEINKIQKKYNVQFPQLDFDLLLAASIKKDRTFLYTHPQYKLNWREFLRFKYFLCKHKRGFSIAAVIEKKEFYNLNFYVNKHTLIPRPDTEIMVEEAINLANNSNSATLIDVGTGSGCIPIAVLKNTQKITSTIAIDISSTALRVARKNSQTHQTKIDFRCGNLLAPIKTTDIKTNTLIITANLPYLTLAQTTQEKSVKKEPYFALCGGKDGLDVYRQLLDQIANLKNKPQTTYLLLEIDPAQTAKTQTIIAQKIPTAKTKIRQDLAGLDRLVIVEF